MWKWEVEESAKATIVMVHGASEHHGRYKWVIEMWRSEHMNVVMGDLPGQGTTTRKRGHIKSFDEYIEAIEQWVQEAELYKLPVFLLGHSMGGLAVIRAMQEKHLPVEAVMLSSPCLGIMEPPSLGLDLLTKGLNIVTPSMLFKSDLNPGVATRNKEVMDQDENDSLYVTKVSVRWYRELVKAMKLANRNVHKFPDIPLLVMQAGDDKIVDKEIVREWFDKLDISEKMLKEWSGLYHEILNEPERDGVFKFANAFVQMHL